MRAGASCRVGRTCARSGTQMVVHQCASYEILVWVCVNCDQGALPDVTCEMLAPGEGQLTWSIVRANKPLKRLSWSLVTSSTLSGRGSARCGGLPNVAHLVAVHGGVARGWRSVCGGRASDPCGSSSRRAWAGSWAVSHRDVAYLDRSSRHRHLPCHPVVLGWRSDSAGGSGLRSWLRGALESLVGVHVVHVCHVDRWAQAWNRSRCCLDGYAYRCCPTNCWWSNSNRARNGFYKSVAEVR